MNGLFKKILVGLGIFAATVGLGLLAFNVFLNYQQTGYFSWKKAKGESAEELEAKERRGKLEEAQLNALKGFNAENKGEILRKDKEYLGIKDKSERIHANGSTSPGVLIFNNQILEVYNRILKDFEDFYSNEKNELEEDEYDDNYSPHLVRNNCILYGAPGTGKTEFVRELNRELIEKHGTDENEINNFAVFEINGEKLQTGGATTQDLNTHEKLIEIIKNLKEKEFGDAESVKPYIVFVDEADQARNTLAGNSKNGLLEEWKNFLSNSNDSGGLKKNAQDRNSIIIIATNNFDGLDPALKRRGRLGKKINFTWNPATLKEYSQNSNTQINWPQINGKDDPNWKFEENKEYAKLYKMAEKFGFKGFEKEFVPKANEIIADWQNWKNNNKEEYESHIKFMLGEEKKVWCNTCQQEVDKETDGQRLKRINQAVKDEVGDLTGEAKKDAERETSEREKKITKGKCGDEAELTCNWLLHFMHTFHFYNDKQDGASFTKASQIKRYEFGDNQLLRERIRELADELYNANVELGNAVGTSLSSLVSTLDGIKEEINATEIRAMKDEAYNVKKDLQKAQIDVQSLETQINNIAQKIHNLGRSSSNSSGGFTSSQKNSILSAFADVKNIMNDLNTKIASFAQSLNNSGKVSSTVINQFQDLQNSQNALIRKINNLQAQIT